VGGVRVCLYIIIIVLTCSPSGTMTSPQYSAPPTVTQPGPTCRDGVVGLLVVKA